MQKKRKNFAAWNTLVLPRSLARIPMNRAARRALKKAAGAKDLLPPILRPLTKELIEAKLKKESEERAVAQRKIEEGSGLQHSGADPLRVSPGSGDSDSNEQSWEKEEKAEEIDGDEEKEKAVYSGID